MAASAPPWKLWLRRIAGHSNPARRLICFPHAGAGASAFHPLAEHLPAEIELWAVQYPAREDRSSEAAPTDLIAMAGEVGYALQWLRDLPYAFFGHSMGAIVAYEAARRLPKLGIDLPVRLFASACAAPNVFALESMPTGRVEDLMRHLGRGVSLLDDPEARRMLVSTVQNDLRMIGRYVLAEDGRLACPITACIGVADLEVRHVQAVEWNRFTTGSFELEKFDGDHFYLLDRPAEVCSMIARHLDRDAVS
ncbi:alpha/beta fold hydrolase [Actinomadura fulvescens]|uniref:Alpha/beta fold hydrolase n=1 Tax=Actinomadura fulvescens TaxID=46160 RepID=A0ABN3Q1W4_9ACTN